MITYRLNKVVLIIPRWLGINNSDCRELGLEGVPYFSSSGLTEP